MYTGTDGTIGRSENIRAINVHGVQGFVPLDAKISTLCVVATSVERSIYPCSKDSTPVNVYITTGGYEQRSVSKDGSTNVGGSNLWPKASTHGVRPRWTP